MFQKLIYNAIITSRKAIQSAKAEYETTKVTVKSALKEDI